jgi:outer membrane murein-binding lipoprotein Lpp
MTIRQRLPLPLRLLYYVVVIALACIVILWAYELGMNFTGANARTLQEDITKLSAEVKTLRAERDQLSSMANAAESQLNMVRATSSQFANQIKQLETENSRLKEDLAFFESLLPTNVGTQGLAIQRFRAEMLAPNQLRYRLLVIQGEKTTREFNGELALQVSGMQDGKPVMLNYPEHKTGADNARYKLSFKYYQRVEGVMSLPAGVTVKSVQVRVMQNGQISAQQSVNL